MQGFAQPSGPAAPGAQNVPVVPSPAVPGGVAPNLTQYPAAPFTGYPPPGFPQPAQSTYPGYFRVPGPQALGPQPGGAAAPAGAGGVAGVSMAPVGTVVPPASPGGPHPLPSLPQVPLPQGFPNPFSLQQVTQAAPDASQAQQGPGTTTVTGPMGYHPGLGYFPQPGAEAGAPSPTAFPVLPGNIQAAAFQPQQGAPQGFAPQGFAPQGFAPQAPPPQGWGSPGFAPAPQGPPTTAPQQQAPNPFWLQLAWQLTQTPAVRQALGEAYQPLLEGEARMRALQLAAGCLASQDLQAAFKALTGGQLEQTRFTELFAQSLRKAFQSAGFLA